MRARVLKSEIQIFCVDGKVHGIACNIYACMVVVERCRQLFMRLIAFHLCVSFRYACSTKQRAENRFCVPRAALRIPIKF